MTNIAKNKTLPVEISALEYYKNLNLKQVMAVIGAEHRNTVWNYVREGKLPTPRYPSPHRPVWRFGELVEHFEPHLVEQSAAPRAYRGADVVKAERPSADVVSKESTPKDRAKDDESTRQVKSLRERLGLGRKG